MIDCNCKKICIECSFDWDIYMRKEIGAYDYDIFSA